MKSNSFLWLIVAVMAVGVWWRIENWRKQVKFIESQFGQEIQLLFRGKFVKETYGCRLDQEGISFRLSQSNCETGRLYSLSANDLITLKIGEESYGAFAASLIKVEVNQQDLTMVDAGWWKERLLHWREHCLGIYRKILLEPHAGLVAGIVLGEKATLSEEFRQALIRTGTMHVVAASGYNVAVVSGILLELLLLVFDRRKAACLSVLFIWFYVLMAGGEPPVLRAGVMASFMMVAMISGRDYWSVWVFVMSGGLLLLLWPWLIASISFQLSLAATAGVLWVRLPVTDGLTWLFTRGWWAKELPQVVLELVETTATTIAALLMTAPISLMAFGEMSLWGLLVNPLVLWLVPLLTYAGLAVLVLGLIALPLGQLGGFALLPLADVWIGLVQLFGNLPELQVSFQTNWLMASGWWLCLLVGYLMWKQRRALL